IGNVFEYVRAVNACLDRKGFKPTAASASCAAEFIGHMRTTSSVLNLFGEDPAAYLKTLRAQVLKERGLSPTDIEKKIAERADARKGKDFAKSDAIRKELSGL